jgi:hypothetical protein
LIVLFYLVVLVFAWDRVLRPGAYFFGAILMGVGLIFPTILTNIPQKETILVGNALYGLVGVAGFIFLLASCFSAGKASLQSDENRQV